MFILGDLNAVIGTDRLGFENSGHTTIPTPPDKDLHESIIACVRSSSRDVSDSYPISSVFRRTSVLHNSPGVILLKLSIGS